MLKSHRSLCVSFSRTAAGLCISHLFVWSDLYLLPTQSCPVLYSFCANWLYSIIMWLMVSSLTLQSLHLLFCCVLSILALIWLVLMALFCVATRRNSVSHYYYYHYYFENKPVVEVLFNKKKKKKKKKKREEKENALFVLLSSQLSRLCRMSTSSLHSRLLISPGNCTA